MIVVLQLEERQVSLLVNLLEYAETAGGNPAQLSLIQAEIKRQAEAQRSGQFSQCGLCHDVESTADKLS